MNNTLYLLKRDRDAVKSQLRELQDLYETEPSDQLREPIALARREYNRARQRVRDWKKQNG